MGIELPRERRTITREDIAAIVGHLIECNRGLHPKDDIDHLGNRRIRANGELIQNAFRIGLLRMERVVRERMTIQEIDKATPNALINIRPVVAAMKEFFGGSQLSQFMDQTNPLAELTQQAPPVAPSGPGGLSRERAGLRRPRRPPQPLRPDLPDRDAGRSEHRPDRLARDLRPDQQLRLHRDARTARSSGPSATTSRTSTEYEAGADLVAKGGDGRPQGRASRSTRRPSRSSRSRRPTPSRSARSSPTRSSTSRPTRRRSTSSPRPTRRSTTRATSPPSGSRRATATRSRRRAPARSSTWTSRPSRSSRSRRRSSRSSSTTTPTARSWARTCSARPCRSSSRSRRSSAPAWRSAPRATRARSSSPRAAASSRASPPSGSAIETDAGELDEYKLHKFVRSNQGTCINQRPIVDVGDAGRRRPADRRLQLDPARASSPSAGTSSWRS